MTMTQKLLQILGIKPTSDPAQDQRDAIERVEELVAFEREQKGKKQ